jgi:hypothetical protein
MMKITKMWLECKRCTVGRFAVRVRRNGAEDQGM